MGLFLGSLQSAWIDRARSEDQVVLEWAPNNSDAESVDSVLAKLTASGRLERLKWADLGPAWKDPKFQATVMAHLETRAPNELRAALASAGNMHNPHIQAIHAPLREAVLSTESVKELSQKLAEHQLLITRVDLEKLELREESGTKRFFGGLVLTITSLPSRMAQ